MATKITFNNFSMYGLNRFRNFLKAPSDNKYIWLENKDEVDDFCMEMLIANDCPESAVFCVHNDGTMRAVFVSGYDEDEEEVFFGVASGKDMHFFASIDGMFRLCCYGLIYEVIPGEWQIQE